MTYSCVQELFRVVAEDKINGFVQGKYVFLFAAVDRP